MGKWISLPITTSKSRSPLKLAIQQKDPDMLKFLVAEMNVSLFDEDIMKEDIAYRNIRKEIRQKELLAASILPPRMQSALAKQSSGKKQEIEV